MKIELNGCQREVPAGVSISDLIAELGLAPEQVAVERNRMLVKRAQHGHTQLVDGDTLEIVSLVGGG